MKKRQRRQEPQEEYSYEQLREEREYGLFWYSWLWNILRPILVILCVTVIVVAGISSARAMSILWMHPARRP